jgi:DNA-binding GntR family transcriptional regulator
MSTSIVSAGANRNQQSLGTPHHFYIRFRELLTRGSERVVGAGDRMLTREELCDQFGVSHETVREAWRSLEGDGTISQTSGQATFVQPRSRACSKTRSHHGSSGRLAVFRAERRYSDR